MNPRPFLRSRLFWLGLPGLAFLLWGWWLSMEYRSGAGFSGAHPFGVSQGAGEVYADWDTAGWPEWQTFRATHQTFSPEHTLGGKAAVAERRRWSPTFHYIFIPYAAVVLVYVVSCLLLLTGWQRRKARLLKLHAKGVCFEDTSPEKD